MRACPQCGRLYPEGSGFCPIDGSALVSATDAPPALSEVDPRVGALLFERYHLRRIVADGGMGRVYEALDVVEKRNVAVKVLHPHVSRDEVQVERLRREFEVSGQLPHEHIAQVFDFRGLEDGSHALTMEFLFGEELRATLARERTLSPARLLRMTSQIAIALDAAHKLKFVHRDLKPDNIFLCQTPEGDVVKVLDFGSVKDRAKGAKQLTQLGTTIGSPFYMAPEQAQGLETLDHRADVWAIGAIAFECMTGEVPFQGLSGPMILVAILTKEPPRASIVAKSHGFELPRAVDDVIERALRKSAALRYDSMGTFADALGGAWGLSGNHTEWAQTPEVDLDARLRRALPDLLRKNSEPVPRTAEDSFFGAADPLAESFPPRPLSSPMAAEAPQSQTGGAPPSSGAPTSIPLSEGPSGGSIFVPGISRQRGTFWLWGGLLLLVLLLGSAFLLR